ncbi:MAG: hypothetical protein QOG46_2549, partial [Pseudonocardiales bacterium]|nr:hypothetical protein [Pseudonocardiales bacterium]
MFGLRRPPSSSDRDRRPARDHGTRGGSNRRGHRLPGESDAPVYIPSIALRSIDGHLVRNGQEVYAWYRLAAQR